MAFSTLFDDIGWEAESTFGMIGISVTSLIFGVWAINTKQEGQQIAIAGVVLPTLGIVGLLGSF